MKTLLEIHRLSAGYGEDDVICDISFELKEGDRLVVLGPNGCGKTTLIRAVTGLIPSGGERLLAGRPFHDYKPAEIAARVAVLAQLETVYFAYSVYETVMLGRYHLLKRKWLSAPDKQDHDAVSRILKNLGLWELRSQLITALSGGQLQRVFLARTFAQEPSIIFLDEPTNHLDLRYQTELIQYLKAWSEEPGHAVCGVLHDMNLASDLAREVLLMSEGKTAAIGRWEDVCTAERLEEVYRMDVMQYMRSSLGRWS